MVVVSKCKCWSHFNKKIRLINVMMCLLNCEGKNFKEEEKGSVTTPTIVN